MQNNEIDENLETLLYAMLKRDPQERLSSIDEVLEHPFCRSEKDKEAENLATLAYLKAWFQGFFIW